MKQTVLLDVDGVLRDIASEIVMLYKRDIDKESDITVDDIKYFNLGRTFTKFKNDAEAADFFFKRRAIETFENANPYIKNISKVVNNLMKYYNVHIVTHQFPGNEKYTLNWLYYNNIPFDSLSFTSDKTKILAHIAIDDYVGNLNDYSMNGYRAIAIRQPWNKEWSGESYKDIGEAVNKLIKEV